MFGLLEGAAMDSLREINMLSICVRIGLALLIGGLLGLERGRKNRPAGFRTYMLVCLGAVMVMVTNQYVFQEMNVSDPVRMGAQVVSGIGFLGAGTILTTSKNQVKGITTAAGLWAAACSGLAVGVGFYEGAVLGACAIFVVMASMQRLDSYIHSRSSVLDIYLEYDGKKAFSSFLEFARQNQLEVTDVQITKSKMTKNNSLMVVLTIKTLMRRNHTDIIELLSTAAGVEHMEEL